jgi:hypothetical protein
VNAPTARFCNSCGFELTEDVARSKDTTRRKIEDTPEFKAAMETATKAAVEAATAQLLEAMKKKDQ